MQLDLSEKEERAKWNNFEDWILFLNGYIAGIAQNYTHYLCPLLKKKNVSCYERKRSITFRKKEGVFKNK